MVKIQFLNPVSQNKFLHNMVNAKKRNSNYKHLYYYLIADVKDKASFRLNDENGEVVVCDIDFYPDENLVEIECSPCDFDKLQSLMLDALEEINEKAWMKFIDTDFFYNSQGEFFVKGTRNEIYKLSSDRNGLLEIEAYRIPMEMRENK